MKIEFDPVKDASNQSRHGVALASAGRLDWDAALAWRDDRFDYHEVRMVALAPIATTLYCVVFVERGDHCRIISLRRANRREVQHDVDQI